MNDRPKVISLWNDNPFASVFRNIESMAEFDIFVQYAAFDIIIPDISTKPRLLNIFEETVLKLANVSIHNTKQVSELICFDNDLTQFVQNKLLSLGYVKKEYTISPDGMAYLNEMEENKSNIKKIRCKVFADASSGIFKLLPYIHTGEVRYEEVMEHSGRIIKISVGSAGKSKSIKGHAILAQEGIDLQQLIKLTQHDIRKCIASFNRFYKNQAMLNNGFEHQ